MTDLRCREALDNLAVLADNPSTIPSFSLLAHGKVLILDTGTVMSQTSWTRALATLLAAIMAVRSSRTISAARLMRRYRRTRSLRSVPPSTIFIGGKSGCSP